jgi:hypothetical protein
MKHIALFLAIIIFALSLASCSNLNYYKGAGWSCSQEEFLEKYYDPIGAEIMEIAEKHEIKAVIGGTNIMDDIFVLFVYDASFTARCTFFCEELWCNFTIDLHYYGSDESQLNDYSVQKKYVDFLNEVVSTFAYDIESDTCKFEDSFNYCLENEVEEHKTQIQYDAMTGGTLYSVSLGVDENVGNHTLRNKTGEAFMCNCYHFQGLLSGDLDNILAD